MRGDFAHGVAFVPLAPLRDPDLVLPTVATVLGVRPAVGESLPDSLKVGLGSRHQLLILDNFEHLLDAGVRIAQREHRSLTNLIVHALKEWVEQREHSGQKPEHE